MLRPTMADKCKAKRVLEELAKPSNWRLQQGGFSEPIRNADPETGTPVAHRCAVDTLGPMRVNGNITPQMHEAGCINRTLFRSAALDGIATSLLIRLAGATGSEMSGRQIDARRRVNKALGALGGHQSPAGSIAWFVVGLEMSSSEWAARQGWGGRPVPQPIASGVIVVALGISAMHFGLTPRLRAA